LTDDPTATSWCGTVAAGPGATLAPASRRLLLAAAVAVVVYRSEAAAQASRLQRRCEC